MWSLVEEIGIGVPSAGSGPGRMRQWRWGAGGVMGERDRGRDCDRGVL